jgi:carbon storage regulator CsrA
MLVLSRHRNEKVVLPGLGATIQVLDIRRGVVRLGIVAPPEVIVLREELVGKPRREADPKEPEPRDL